MGYNFSREADDLVENIAESFCDEFPGEVDVHDLTDEQYEALSWMIEDKTIYNHDLLALIATYCDINDLARVFFETEAYDDFYSELLSVIEIHKSRENH